MASDDLLLVQKWMAVEPPTSYDRLVPVPPDIAALGIRARVEDVIAQENRTEEQYNACIPYVAMGFFDTFISRDKIPVIKYKTEDYNIRSVAISCLFIALKLRDKSLNINVFMAKRPHLALKVKHVNKVGSQILKVIGPPTDRVTPLFYVTSLLSLVQELDMSNKVNVVKLIMNFKKEQGVRKFAPSVLAAAAVSMTVGSNAIEKFEKCARMFIGRDVGMKLYDIGDAMITIRMSYGERPIPTPKKRTISGTSSKPEKTWDESWESAEDTLLYRINNYKQVIVQSKFREELPVEDIDMSWIAEEIEEPNLVFPVAENKIKAAVKKFLTCYRKID